MTPTPNSLPSSPVCASCWRAMRFHMGTISFSSLIIAVIQFVRWCVAYVEEKTRGDPRSKCQQAVFCLCYCLLWCLECCMDKISKNALVFTAIYGDSFCPAVCGSFALIFSNLGRVAAINMVSHTVMGMGKLLISLATAGICAIIMNQAYGSKEVSGIALPVVICFLIGYMVATFMIGVFETAVDTIFICFLVDEASAKGNTPLRASAELQALVGKYADESKKIADEKKKNGTRAGTEMTAK